MSEDTVFSPIEALPLFKSLVRRIRDDKSVVLRMPWHYGQDAIADALGKHIAAAPNSTALHLTVRQKPGSHEVDYEDLWGQLKAGLSSRRRTQVLDSSDFLNSTEALFEGLKDRVTLILSRKSGLSSADYSGFLGLLNGLLRHLEVKNPGVLTVVAIADFSLEAWDPLASEDRSDWAFLERMNGRPLARAEIDQVTGDCSPPGFSNERVGKVAEEVFLITGGHPGLTLEVLNDLSDKGWLIGTTYWDDCRVVLGNSRILEDLRSILNEEKEGFCQTALEYVEPTYPVEPASTRLALLRQAGILQWQSPSEIRLCPGVISDLVKAIAAAPAYPRLGTVVSETGLRMFENGVLQKTADDIVVLHLSDLHVGEGYGFQLSWSGGQMNEDRPTLGELVSDDLERLGLLGAVDAVIVTGDISCSGKIAEFNRARTLLTDLLGEISVPADRLMVIPGNHDVDWAPSNFAATENGLAISREAFETFLELLPKQGNGAAKLLKVVSESGSTSLRLLGLDSNDVEGPSAAGIGFVSEKSLSEAAALIERDSDPEDGDNQHTWLAIHHHVFPATSHARRDAAKSKVTVMANAVRLLDFAKRVDAQVVLHGHEHQPSVTVARRWPQESPLDFGRIAAVGAGSASARAEDLGPFKRNQYFVLHLSEHGLLVRSRALGDNGRAFVGHSDLLLNTKTTGLAGTTD